MNFMKKIKQLIKLSDIFYSSELLRYQKQNQFQTLTGGILSIAIWTTIAVSFTSMVLETFRMTNITSETTIEKLSDPPNTIMRTGPQSKFMFGIRITDLMNEIIDLNNQKRYFDVYFTDASFSAGNLQGYNFHLLQKCTKEHWQDFPKILQNFDKLQMDYWLCPPIDTVFNLSGLYTSAFSEVASFSITNCNNLTNLYSVCASPEEIDEYFLNKTNFSFNLYFTNPILNPNKPDYIDYYLEQNANAIFSKSLGSQTQIFLADYEINSDSSIWPFIASSFDYGTILDGNIVNRPYIIGPGSQYFVAITIFKSSSFYRIQREVRKISSVFSYIGGFFGAITAALFIIKSYTDSAFQFSLSNTLFSLTTEDKNKTVEGIQSFDFFKFIGMKCYTILQKFGLSIQWTNMNTLIEGQQQIKHHLDIVSLLRRIIMLQDLFTFVLEDYQLEGIKMQRNKSLEFAKQLRKKFSQQQLENSGECSLKLYDLSSPFTMNDYNQPALDQQPQPPIIFDQKQNLRSPSQHKVGSEISDIQCVDFSNSQNIPVKYQQANSKTGKHPVHQETKKVEHLINLKNSAAENQISMKIWKRIPQNLKEKVPNYRSINSF